MEFIFIGLALIIGFVVGYVVPKRRPKADGVIEVTEGAKTIFQLEITTEPEALALKPQVVFDIVKKPQEEVSE